ncbi:MAG: toxin-antitoxin system protein [Chloroflexota bacterium]
MSTVTVKISETGRERLRELAVSEGASMQAILERAIEYYRRRRFLEGVNAAYAGLQQDSEATATLNEERALWDATLMDGLSPDEEWTEQDQLIADGLEVIEEADVTA